MSFDKKSAIENYKLLDENLESVENWALENFSTHNIHFFTFSDYFYHSKSESGVFPPKTQADFSEAGDLHKEAVYLEIGSNRKKKKKFLHISSLTFTLHEIHTMVNILLIGNNFAFDIFLKHSHAWR